jgi:hypothetical protein
VTEWPSTLPTTYTQVFPAAWLIAGSENEEATRVAARMFFVLKNFMFSP